MTRTVDITDVLGGLRERQVSFLRIGAVCASVGTLGYLVAFLLHGNLPDETTESVLTFIAARPWSLHHFAIVVCFLLWAAALGGLGQSLTGGAAWVAGRLGQVGFVLGLTVLLWHYNIDGPALEQVADAWSTTSGAEQAAHLERGTVLLLATAAMFPLYVTLLLGVPFVLFGIAVVLDRNYPTWLGWLGVAAGGLASVVGATNFVGLDLLPRELFVLPVFVLDFWMLALARLMWRRARQIEHAAQPVV